MRLRPWIEGNTQMAVMLSCLGRMRDAFNFPITRDCRHTFHFWRKTCADCQVKAVWRSSCHCLDCLSVRTEVRHSMISVSFRKALSEKEDIGRGSFGWVFTAKRSDGIAVVVEKLLRQHEHETRRKLL